MVTGWRDDKTTAAVVAMQCSRCMSSTAVCRRAVNLSITHHQQQHQSQTQARRTCDNCAVIVTSAGWVGGLAGELGGLQLSWRASRIVVDQAQLSMVALFMSDCATATHCCSTAAAALN